MDDNRFLEAAMPDLLSKLPGRLLTLTHCSDWSFARPNFSRQVLGETCTNSRFSLLVMVMVIVRGCNTGEACTNLSLPTCRCTGTRAQLECSTQHTGDRCQLMRCIGSLFHLCGMVTDGSTTVLTDEYRCRCAIASGAARRPG